MTSLPVDAPRPRLCLVRKRTPEEEYGFNLHAEKNKGQFIGAVDSGSPADNAGLRPGDRIIAVNGVSVISEAHKQVVAKIKENALYCDLIVVDEETQAWYNDHKVPIPIDPSFAERAPVDSRPAAREQTNGTVDASSETSHKVGSESFQRSDSASPPAPRPPSYQEAVTEPPTCLSLRPRLCILAKPEPTAEFGFNLLAEKNSGHYIGKVDPDSIAEHAGVEKGQRIVGVNGVLVYPNTPHKEVVSLIKLNPIRAELLLASPDVDAFHKANAKAYDFATAESFEPIDPHDVNAINKGVDDLTIVNGYSATNDDGVNGGKNEEMVTNGARRRSAELAQCEEERRLSSSDSTHYASGPYTQSRPPPSVQPYESTVESQLPTHKRQPQQPDWMQLSAAQLRERVGQHKKADPRTKQLSLQQKHELIRNM